MRQICNQFTSNVGINEFVVLVHGLFGMLVWWPPIWDLFTYCFLPVFVSLSADLICWILVSLNPKFVWPRLSQELVLVFESKFPVDTTRTCRLQPAPCTCGNNFKTTVPYPQRLAQTKLLHLEPNYARFLDVLKRVYADTPILEALKKTPAYLQFVRDFLSKIGEPERGSVMPIRRVCSSILELHAKL